MRFFDQDGDRAQLPAYDAPRPLVGAVQQLNLAKGRDRIDKRPPQDWQLAAWRMFESIGEIHFAFSLVGEILSRVRLYTAVVLRTDEPPVPLESWLEDVNEKTGEDPAVASKVAATAMDLLRDLTEHTPGRAGGLMRTLGLNLSVPGEAFLVRDDALNQWRVLSTEELTSQGKRWRVRSSRITAKGTGGGDRVLQENAFVARLYQPSPRFSDEPDSSMLGVLDTCEELVLLDQAMRAAARRAMNAGLVFVPDGLSAYSATTDDQTLADAIAETALSAVESEGAASTVTPRVITGPAEMGEAIRLIRLTDMIDPKMGEEAQRLLDRIMAGIDIPKDVVKGVADVKYANAIVIDDNLYRLTIEPLVLLIVDCLTSAYLRPLLLKEMKTDGETAMAQRIVVWGDTSAIVVRPDKSAAADTGYNNHILSAEAWRRSRGFAETDAPSDDELLVRLVLEKATLPPEAVTAMLERIAPEFWESQREQGASEAGIPNDIGQLLSGQMPPGPTEGGPPMEESLSGGPVPPGGTPAPAPR